MNVYRSFGKENGIWIFEGIFLYIVGVRGIFFLENFKMEVFRKKKMIFGISRLS